MGVNGLWSLLEPAARPIALETLSGKRLAIDASIWLYQFQMAMRDKKTGETLHGAHLTGTFQRIIKLLYHGIKPVFVFDGDAPMLKKRTIAERKRRKAGASRDHAKVAKELLSAQLRATAANEMLRHRTNQELKKSNRKGKGKARDQDDYDSEEQEEDELDTGDLIDPNKVVYLEDLERGSNISPPKNNNSNHASTSKLVPPSSLLPTASKRFVPKDQYALPTLEGPLESRAQASDPRIATIEEQTDFLEDLLPEDLDSELFLSLPIEQKYEIIGDMRLRSRQVNHKRVKDSIHDTPLDFSKTQILNLMQRNTLTQKLFSVTDELGAGKDKVLVPSRVAGERNREYVLVKQNISKGGGWVLGIQDDARRNNEPIIIEDSTDESFDEGDDNNTGTDDDLFEEVGIPPRNPSPGYASVDREVRRSLAIEALIARHVPNASTPLDPFLDQPSTSKTATSSKISSSLFRNLSTGNGRTGRMTLEEEDYGEGEGGEEIDPYLQAALVASLKDFQENERDDEDDEEEEEWEEVPTALLNPPEVVSKMITNPIVIIEKEIDESGILSDDSLEYVDDLPPPLPPPPQLESQTQSRPYISAALQAKALSTQVTRMEDSDDSDDFEEVIVRPPSNPLPLPPITNIRSSIYSESNILTSSVDTTSTSSLKANSNSILVPIPISRRIPKSLMDSILPSDSSDSEEEITVESRIPSLPTTEAQPARDPQPSIPSSNLTIVKNPTRTRRDYSPEPFMMEESHKEEQDSVLVRDFGAPTTSIPSTSKTLPAEEMEVEFSSPIAIAQQPSILKDVSAKDTTSLLDLQELQDFADNEVSMPSRERISLSPVIKMEVDHEFMSTLSDQQDVKSLRTEDDSGPSDEEEIEEVVPKSPQRQESPIIVEKVIVEEQLEKAEQSEEEEEEEIEWEKSPTPPPRQKSKNLFKPIEEDLPEDFEEEPDFIREEREDNERKLIVEQDQYNLMERELTNKSLEDMRKENQAEVERLKAKKNQAQRNADGVTRAMASEIKELLFFFGIPYVDAPEEAEAECAQLLQLQLVDGIVTDDSDVFLFGGARIFRNMFNNDKTVQCYLLSDLEKDLGLDRDKLVRLAYLLGGDYTDGLKGVGPVLGRELLEEFEGKDGLKKFKEWWLKVQNGKDTDDDNFSAWRRKFKKGHKNLFLDENWPNPVIAQAYYKPTVNHDDEAFSWSALDLDGIRTYLYNTISRPTEKTDDLLVPLIKRQNARKNGELKLQANLGQYFDITAGNGPLAPRNQRVGYQSARLQNVVQSFRKNQKRIIDEESSSNESSLEEYIRPLPPPSKRRKSPGQTLPTLSEPQSSKLRATPPPLPAKSLSPSKKKLSGPTRKRAPAKLSMAARRKAERERRDGRAAANGGVYSDDDREEIIADSKKRSAKPRRKKGRRVEDEEEGESM